MTSRGAPLSTAVACGGSTCVRSTADSGGSASTGARGVAGTSGAIARPRGIGAGVGNVPGGRGGTVGGAMSSDVTSGSCEVATGGRAASASAAARRHTACRSACTWRSFQYSQPARPAIATSASSSGISQRLVRSVSASCARKVRHQVALHLHVAAQLDQRGFQRRHALLGRRGCRRRGTRGAGGLRHGLQRVVHGAGHRRCGRLRGLGRLQPQTRHWRRRRLRADRAGGRGAERAVAGRAGGVAAPGAAAAAAEDSLGTGAAGAAGAGAAVGAGAGAGAAAGADAPARATRATGFAATAAGGVHSGGSASSTKRRDMRAGQPIDKVTATTGSSTVTSVATRITRAAGSLPSTCVRRSPGLTRRSPMFTSARTHSGTTTSPGSRRKAAVKSSGCAEHRRLLRPGPAKGPAGLAGHGQRQTNQDQRQMPLLLHAGTGVGATEIHSSTRRYRRLPSAPHLWWQAPRPGATPAPTSAGSHGWHAWRATSRSGVVPRVRARQPPQQPRPGEAGAQAARHGGRLLLCRARRSPAAREPGRPRPPAPAPGCCTRSRTGTSPGRHRPPCAPTVSRPWLRSIR